MPHLLPRVCGDAQPRPTNKNSRPVGALFFPGRRADARPMPRYFFILVYPNRVIGDPRGTVVPSDEAAIGAAREIIDELLEGSGPGEPRPIIMLRNEAGEKLRIKHV
jgi:hypothetical protein